MARVFMLPYILLQCLSFQIIKCSEHLDSAQEKTSFTGQPLSSYKRDFKPLKMLPKKTKESSLRNPSFFISQSKKSQPIDIPAARGTSRAINSPDTEESSILMMPSISPIKTRSPTLAMAVPRRDTPPPARARSSSLKMITLSSIAPKKPKGLGLKESTTRHQLDKYFLQADMDMSDFDILDEDEENMTPSKGNIMRKKDMRKNLETELGISFSSSSFVPATPLTSEESDSSSPSVGESTVRPETTDASLSPLTISRTTSDPPLSRAVRSSRTVLSPISGSKGNGIIRSRSAYPYTSKTPFPSPNLSSSKASKPLNFKSFPICNPKDRESREAFELEKEERRRNKKKLQKKETSQADDASPSCDAEKEEEDEDRSKEKEKEKEGKKEKKEKEPIEPIVGSFGGYSLSCYLNSDLLGELNFRETVKTDGKEEGKSKS